MLENVICLLKQFTAKIIYFIYTFREELYIKQCGNMNQNAEENKKIEIAKILSPKLGFRDSAKDFFHMINQLPADVIEIDFTEVKFMSRSFANEYIQQKKKSKKTIQENNISENVNAMLQAVKKSVKNPHKLEVKPTKIIALS
ncbi:MAG: hypothetical protein A4E27_01483 [Methanobacterium sp. PtaU1.Bin242]|nr:MAG: hypothetical protein A4E27_01483 [Methanobacterium sp. PtaU1.Bin242]